MNCPKCKNLNPLADNGLQNAAPTNTAADSADNADTAVGGLMGMAGGLVQNNTSESEAKRNQVDVSGDGVDMNKLEQAVGRIDFSRLEGMKLQGSAPQ